MWIAVACHVKNELLACKAKANSHKIQQSCSPWWLMGLLRNLQGLLRSWVWKDTGKLRVLNFQPRANSFSVKLAFSRSPSVFHQLAPSVACCLTFGHSDDLYLCALLLPGGRIRSQENLTNACVTNTTTEQKPMGILEMCAKRNEDQKLLCDELLRT